MPLVTRSAADVFAPTTATGQPRGGDMGEVRTWAIEVQRLAQSAAESGGALIYATRAALYADLTPPNNAMAWVKQDPTFAYNGIYRKSGAAGFGVWVFSGGFLDQSVIDALGGKVDGMLASSLAQRQRPGAASAYYTTAVTGGQPETLPLLPSSWIVNGERGTVVRLTGEAVLSRRDYIALEPGRKYRIRNVLQRQVNAVGSDTVRVGVAWYDRNYDLVTTTVLQSYGALSTADGRTTAEKVVSSAAGTGIDVAAPSSARYFRAFAQTLGSTTQQTDFEVMAEGDVSDLELWSPSLSSLDGRVGAIESLNPGTRLTSLETAIGSPKKATFPTYAAFLAATIASTVDAVETLGDASIYDGYGRIWLLSDAANGTMQSADGKWWKRQWQRPISGLYAGQSNNLEHSTTTHLSIPSNIWVWNWHGYDLVTNDENYIGTGWIRPNDLSNYPLAAEIELARANPGVDFCYFVIAKGAQGMEQFIPSPAYPGASATIIGGNPGSDGAAKYDMKKILENNVPAGLAKLGITTISKLVQSIGETNAILGVSLSNQRYMWEIWRQQLRAYSWFPYMTPIFQLSLCPYNAGFTTFNDYLATWTTTEPQVLHWVDIGNLPAGWWDLTVHLKDPGFVAAGRLVAEAVRGRLNTTIEGRYTPTGGGITNVGPISGASIKWARNKKNTRITGSVTATPSGAGNCRVDLTGPPAGFFAASEPLGVGAARRVASGALSPAQVISNGSTGLSLLFTATDSSPVLLTFTGDGDALT